ncbi:SKA complex subunit 3 [Aplochiton taeniatus]
MNSSLRFFAKLRNLAVSLETETASLQHAHQNFESDDDNTEAALQVLHELHSEVRGLKAQVQDQFANLKAGESDVRSFIKACMVLKQKTTEDIQRLKQHCEKYGYQAPKTQGNLGDAAAKSEDKEHEREGSNEEQEGQRLLPPVTPLQIPAPPSMDPMRTPQLSDFGLSEIHLKKVLSETGFPSEVAPTPMMILPPPSQYFQPAMPKTPKCTLHMDEEDDPLTPCIDDFGISENTMSFNNDFTMDLRSKKHLKTNRAPGVGVKPHKPSYILSTPPPNSVMESMANNNDIMESPEPPVFCTPGFKISKTNICSSPPPHGEKSLEIPCSFDNRPTTPEVPAFQTPYINRLLSHGKRSAKVNRTDLESTRGARQTPIPTIELDGPTEDFNLGTPRVRGGGYPDPGTPEMPDLSSVTQDICKLVLQSQCKKSSSSTVQPQTKPSGKENRSQSLPLVSEKEFLNLPSYLKQMPLSGLNQAVQKINSATAMQHHGGDAGFQMEELKNITGLGTKAPLYFLCLTVLKRLEHVQGVGASVTYKIVSHA